MRIGMLDSCCSYPLAQSKTHMDKGARIGRSRRTNVRSQILLANLQDPRRLLAQVLGKDWKFN